MNRVTTKLRLSIILPCFNEEAVLPLTNRRIFETLGQQSDIELEVVYVNDGSSDATETLLAEYAARDPRIKIVSLTRNFGHQASPMPPVTPLPSPMSTCKTRRNPFSSC
jgi:glycosyltransferase involved in cell wall biosynthesis